MTTAQVAALTTAGVAAIETTDLAALRTSQIVALRTSSIEALTTSQIEAFRTAQIVALTTTQIAALTTSQMVAMETTDIAALKTAQVVAIGTTAIAELTTSQIDALRTHQVEALTSSQIAALTTTQISYLHLGTPIVLDMDGDGVKTMSISSGVKFDLFAAGKDSSTGWVDKGDGLLALDRNGDGVINDGSELFGSSTKLATGKKAQDGYAALRDLDANKDGVIDANDAAFKDLRVWIDGNSDGVSQAGEVKSMQDVGIAKISTEANKSFAKDNGNWVGLTSSYETVDGKTHAAADVWFVADKSGKADEDLRNKVSGMAQSIGAFQEAASAGGQWQQAGIAGLNSVSAALASSELPTAQVHQMVDVLKQFDANGNLLAAAPDQAAVDKSLTTLNGVNNPLQNGILAT